MTGSSTQGIKTVLHPGFRTDECRPPLPRSASLRPEHQFTQVMPSMIREAAVAAAP